MNHQVYTSNGTVTSDTENNANSIPERDGNGDEKANIYRGMKGLRSLGHFYLGLLAKTVGFTADETTSNNATVYSCDATSGDLTVSLQASSSSLAGKQITVKKIDSSANRVIVDPAGSELIDGAQILGLYRQWSSVTLINDGTQWLVVGDRPNVLAVATAASSAISNSVVETAFDNVSLSLLANSLRQGDVIRIKGQALVTAQNATDTLTVKVKIGSTIIETTGAVDPATNDLVEFEVVLTVRTVGAGGTAVCVGEFAFGADSVISPKEFKDASFTLDTTAAQAVTVTGQWSVANAGNSARLDTFLAELVS